MTSNRWFLGVLALLALIAGGYAVHEHSQAATAKQANVATLNSLQATNAQVDQLRAKLDQILATAKPAADTPPEQAAPRMTASVPTRRQQAAHHAQKASRHVQRDDPRWQKVQSQLDEQGKAIESTRSDLTTAKTELGDSIARTHGELVVLQRKGERNYYEFDINKQKGFNTVGPMGIRLRKANVKHQYSDLELLVDDRSLTKKHVNLYEPAMFYSAEGEQPVQVVVNAISKDHIHGYVSAPKYRPSELAAQQNAAQPAAAPDAATQPPARRKLTSAR